jgi:hypothetical protein
MNSPKEVCRYHLNSSLAALDAALEEIEDAVTILKVNNAGLVGNFTTKASLKIHMINSLLDLLETDPTYIYQATSHQDETSHKTKQPIDPSRN